MMKRTMKILKPGWVKPRECQGTSWIPMEPFRFLVSYFLNHRPTLGLAQLLIVLLPPIPNSCFLELTLFLPSCSTVSNHLGCPLLPVHVVPGYCLNVSNWMSALNRELWKCRPRALRQRSHQTPSQQAPSGFPRSPSEHSAEPGLPSASV